MKPSETATEVGRAIYAMVEAGETISAAMIATMIDEAYPPNAPLSNAEKAMAEYTRKELRRLARYECALCDAPLHQDMCCAIYGKCSAEIRAKRRTDCLAAAKARGE